MEASGIVFRQPLSCYSRAGSGTIHTYRKSKSYFSAAASLDAAGLFASDFCLSGFRQSDRVTYLPIKSCRNFYHRNSMNTCGFRDDGHMQYYYPPSLPRCCATGGGGKQKKGNVKGEEGSGGMPLKTKKKKLKLLKGLTKDFSAFSDMGLDMDPAKAKMISEASEILVEQLQQLRAEEKESERRKKQDKAKLKMKPTTTLDNWEVSSSSSSSESSDGECGEVIDLNCLRREKLSARARQPPSLLLGESLPVSEEVTILEGNNCLTSKQKGACCSGLSSTNITVDDGTDHGSSSCVVVAKPVAPKRIEVCMGNKCKKSGAAALLKEFDRRVGVEAAVVGCKCMGRCRDGPNVRFLTRHDDIDQGVSETPSSSNSTPLTSLCIGVVMGDVAGIATNFFGDDRSVNNLLAPA